MSKSEMEKYLNSEFSKTNRLWMLHNKMMKDVGVIIDVIICNISDAHKPIVCNDVCKFIDA